MSALTLLPPLAQSLTTAAPVVLPIGGAGLLTATIVQVTKDAALLPFTMKDRTLSASAQEKIVRLYVYLVAAVVVFADAWLTYSLHSRTDILNDLSVSAAVAAVALGSYHILTTDAPIAAVVAVPSPAPVVPVIAETKAIPPETPAAS